MKGRVHSYQSLGTVDGPGIRYVVFLQGCNLRCAYCHNPDTWDFGGGEEVEAKDVVEKAVKYKDFFGKKGGITLSGGEPLCQAEFCTEILKLAKESGLNTCVDTSGDLLNDKTKEMLNYADRVLLDVKFKSDDEYKKYVGCNLSTVLDFLKYLNEKKIPTTLRKVIVPTLTDGEDSIEFLNELVSLYPCVDKIELLPFRKICQAKYDNMGIPFPFGDLETPTKKDMEKLEKLLNI